MEPIKFVGPPLEAFLGFDCRPLLRWDSCGSTYQHSLRIFFAAFCTLHAISTVAALFYSVWTFCPCCGRHVASRNRKTSLRVFTCFSLAAFSCTPNVQCFALPSTLRLSSALFAIHCSIPFHLCGPVTKRFASSLYGVQLLLYTVTS
jgi:hypothetical protein